MSHSLDFFAPQLPVYRGNMYIFSGKVHPPQQAALRGDPARGCRLVGQLAPALVPTSPDNRGLFRDFSGFLGILGVFSQTLLLPFPSLFNPPRNSAKALK